MKSTHRATTSKSRRTRAHKPAATSPEIPPLTTDEPALLDRPDGVYWQSFEDGEAFGPFESYELARADFARFDEERPVPGETLEEAELESGLNTWLDEDTGEPAEGQSPPHLRDR